MLLDNDFDITESAMTTEEIVDVLTSLVVDLYGYCHESGLAVYQVRKGDWDSKRNYGNTTKTYYIIDSYGYGYKIEVPHGKVRGAARSRPADLGRPVIAALRDALGYNPYAATEKAYSRKAVNLKELRAEIGRRRLQAPAFEALETA